MEHYVFEGVIKEIGDIQEFKNNFKKREIVITSPDEYPQDIKFEFTDEAGINKLDTFELGETVKIAFQLRGNSYQGKYFTNLRGIAIASDAEDGKKAPAKKNVTVQKSGDKTGTFIDNGDNDDLPF